MVHLVRAPIMSQSLELGHSPAKQPSLPLSPSPKLEHICSREKALKEINPHRIDLSEFFHFDDVDSAADHRIKAKACHRKLGLDVEDCLFTLCFNVSGENYPAAKSSSRQDTARRWSRQHGCSFHRVW